MKTTEIQIQIARFETVPVQVPHNATPVEINAAAEEAAEAAGPGWVVVDTDVEGE